MAKDSSEALFQDYLRGNGLEFRYEPDIKGRTKRPDYEVQDEDGRKVYCDVKAFMSRGKLPTSSFQVVAPYRPVRKKIDVAAEQFREYGEYPCYVVLHEAKFNPRRADLRPDLVMAAMLGDLGVTFGVDPQTGKSWSSGWVHLAGGKMLNTKKTTIAGLAILTQVNPLDVLMSVGPEAGNGATTEDLSDFVAAAEEALGRVREMRCRWASRSASIAGVVLVKNPFAKHGDKGDRVFSGPYDEHWAMEEDVHGLRGPVRVWAGAELLALEEQGRTAWQSLHGPAT